MKTSTTSPNLWTSLKKSLGFAPWAFLLWILLWQILSIFIDRFFLLASPLQVFQRLIQLAFQHSFWQSLLYSSGRILLGFFIGFASALILACASAKSPWLRELLKPPMAFIKAAPVASFIILCLIWLPSRQLSTFISFLMVLPVIYTHVQEGIDQMDKNLLEMATVFRLSSWRKLRFIHIPQIFPYLSSSCHLALGLCWKAGIAAEVIGIPMHSIGEQIYNAKIYLSSADLFAWTLVIIALSLLFDHLFMRLLNRLLLQEFSASKS